MKKSIFPEIVNQMIKKGEKVKDVAQLIGLDSSQVSRKLSGEVEWTFSDVEILCEHYNISFEKLFKRKED